MATTTLQTNSANDLYLPDGKNLAVISGIPACAQNILQATLMRLGENIYGVLEGVDYFGTIFTPQPDYDAFRQSLADAILGCPDVISIESLTVAVVGNNFNYTALVNTIYGPIPVSNS